MELHTIAADERCGIDSWLHSTVFNKNNTANTGVVYILELVHVLDCRGFFGARGVVNLLHANMENTYLYIYFHIFFPHFFILLRSNYVFQFVTGMPDPCTDQDSMYIQHRRKISPLLQSKVILGQSLWIHFHSNLSLIQHVEMATCQRIDSLTDSGRSVLWADPALVAACLRIDCLSGQHESIRWVPPDLLEQFP